MVFTRRNLDWWCGRGILSLVLAMLVFAPLAFGAVRMWTFLVVQGLATGVMVLWLVRLGLGRRPKLHWPPLAWAVAMFALYAVARYFTADIEYAARLELNQVWLFALLFLAVVNHLHKQDAAKAVSFTLIGLATAIAGYAVAQLLRHSSQVWNEVAPYVGRASGTYISPNHCAGFLGMLLPLALAFLIVGKIKVTTRILLAYALVVMVAGLAVTFSRAGWAASGAGVLLVLGILLGHRNHRRWAALLLVVMLAVGAVGTSQYLSKTLGYMRRINQPDDNGPGVLDVSSRLEMWRAAAQMWRDHFWWGVGPAHFDFRFREYRPESFQLRPELAHNDYLNLLADWGTAGGLIVLAGMGIFGLGLVQTWPHVRREENVFGSGRSNRFALFLGATGGLFALAVHSFVDFNLHIPANALVGVTLLGLVASQRRAAIQQRRPRLKWPGKLALSLVLVAGTVYFVAQEWRLGREAWWLAQARRAPAFSPMQVEALKKAFAAEPKNFQTAYDLGECFRNQSFENRGDYAALGRQAVDWYAVAIRCNPLGGYPFLRTGMCLDWLGRPMAAEPYFSAAEQRDPNGCYTLANIGWHYVQTGDYAAARQCFLRSLQLSNNYNNIARSYLEICDAKLREKASGRPFIPAGGGQNGH